MRILLFFALLFIAACASEPEPMKNVGGEISTRLQDTEYMDFTENFCEKTSNLRIPTKSDWLGWEECLYILMAIDIKDPEMLQKASVWSNGWSDEFVSTVPKNIPNKLNSSALTQFGLDLANSKSQTLACTFSSEQKSGFNKVCYYKCGLDTHATNVASTQICPLTFRR